MIRSLDELKCRVADIILNQSGNLQVLLGVSGFLVSLGFVFGDVGGADYAALRQLMPQLFWAYLFLVYGLTKLYGVIFDHRFCIDLAISSVGIWAWSYILLSFVLFEPSRYTPMEILLVMPVVCEVWSLITTIFKRENDVRNTDCH